ncbi:pirin-like C-terminal cupin domain-containing protein [Curvibacter sp. HBC61]|uniref:Pirin-like C-terminal cupin domain-containing protein n=1 Tax=Curvibacter cyanobacteriorum TaxID=3026422 RepID=A0ABT5MT27_9BURK|nr:pirin-like C-terminal cupin domain-containing protein [Curvibacter sp. HBC61]MDD0837002.1 pirin-like C-terminal cupin domain-containing protein [Curvibacter sp. HBC61]
MKNELSLSPVVDGRPLHIGTGFTALNFDESQFGGRADPVVMLDHFHMTQPTFAPHPHAGLSAVTYVLEESASPHVNYDSLGHEGPIRPGALHWLAAGRGAIHTEQPEGEAPHVHALQIFVNLPARLKRMAPRVVHLEPEDVPVYEAPGQRVRVVLGDAFGLSSPATAALPQPFCLLDVALAAGSRFNLALPAAWGGMLYVMTGEVAVLQGDHAWTLHAGQAMGASLSAEASVPELPLCLQVGAAGPARLIWLGGLQLREPLVKQGPFVMNTGEQMQQAISDYQQGRFGTLRWPR